MKRFVFVLIILALNATVLVRGQTTRPATRTPSTTSTSVSSPDVTGYDWDPEENGLIKSALKFLAKEAIAD